jgi:hypothetical protein
MPVLENTVSFLAFRDGRLLVELALRPSLRLEYRRLESPERQTEDTFGLTWPLIWEPRSASFSRLGQQTLL